VIEITDDEESTDEAIVESENANTQPPDGFVRRYWVLGFGVLLSLIGVAGMLALRLNYAQVYIFGDSNPYTGIGTVEPLGHMVSMIPFTLGIIFIIVWALRTKPVSKRAERSDEALEAEI
jgi:hypothetical protein